MFIPMIVTLIVCRGLTPKRSGVLWKPDFKKSIGWLLLAWFLPALMTAAGAAVYFAVFPKNFSSELYGLSAMLTQQGMDIKLYFQYTGMDMDSFRETYRDRAVNEVKLRLALEKIADLENIQISDEDLNNSLGEIAAANNIDVETVKKFIPVDEYITDLRVQKAIELVKENAVVDNTAADEKAE